MAGTFSQWSGSGRGFSLFWAIYASEAPPAN
jgi:hypothetical protein